MPRFFRLITASIAAGLVGAVTMLGASPAGACWHYDTGLGVGSTCETIKVGDTNCGPINDPPLEGCVP